MLQTISLEVVIINKILFLVPKQSISNEQIKYYKKIYSYIDFFSTDPYNPMLITDTVSLSNYKIIVARGNTASVLKDKFPHIHVIKIPVTPYDIIRSFSTFNNITGKTIALITNNAEIMGLNIFEQLYGVRILNYQLTPFKDFKYTINNAILNNAEYILGGAITCTAAKEMNVNYKMLKLAPESMDRIIHEIGQVISVIDLENKHTQFINNLLNTIDKILISTDINNNINLISNEAEHIFNIKAKNYINKPINSLFDKYNIYSYTNSISDNNIIKINNIEYVLSTTPIQCDSFNFGTIYTIEILKKENIKKYNLKYSSSYKFENIIGSSKHILNTITLARKFANTEHNILITGESGTGKELFSQSIHSASNRNNEPFVAINCASIPDTLVESVLFGYVKGAFTDANKDGKIGAFELANNGTLFLDEISELSYRAQGVILRVIQEKYINKVGSLECIPINVRIIASSNKNLIDLCKSKKFRLDLYYRLNTLSLFIPPLRDRSNDVITILNLLIKNLTTNNYIFDTESENFLIKYTWNGNIRELENFAIRLTTIFTENDNFISLKDINSILYPNIGMIESNSEEEKILNALYKFDGSISKSSEYLGIHRTTLWRKMKEYNIK